MTDLKFTKMHGCGNDYVYVDCTKNVIENIPETSIRVSDRHFGIGSDGLILIKSSEVADFCMDMYNNDGSRGKMCGNGIRCVGKYVYDHQLTDKTTVTIETLSGIKELKLTVEEGKVSLVTVNMGTPITKPSQIPVLSEKEIVISEPIDVDGETYEITCISMGNPHAVVFVEDPSKLELDKLGPKFDFHKVFPERVNTEFVRVINRNHIEMRVWERGSGETLACGTGACASAMASILNGYTDNEVKVSLLGGDLYIRYDSDINTIFMTGPATEVFSGELEL